VTTIYAFSRETGDARRVDHVDSAWLAPGSGHVVWVDLAAPTPDEAGVLSRLFGFHELAIEDALGQTHHPKIESYDGYLYVILHGIDASPSAPDVFATHDLDFFVGDTYLVTVHDGTFRSIDHVRGLCARNPRALAEGPVALMHRIVDAMVDNYLPEVERLEDQLERLEDEVFRSTDREIVRQVLELKRDIGALRRIVVPQRDVMARLARREFAIIDESVGYRFRDVYDHLVRFTDEAAMMHDRVTTVLDAHLSFVSNRMNEVMKVLAIFATIFGPLTVLTGLYGMNVDLPAWPVSDTAQFWVILALMAASTGGMLVFFRRRGWI
jgi:magnesium transporter